MADVTAQGAAPPQLPQFPPAGGLQSQPAPPADLSQNDRVVQLLMMVVKEITESRNSRMMHSNPDMPPRASFESSFSVGSGVPAGGSTSSGRLSMEGFVPMSYNMFPGNHFQDPNR